MSWTLLDRLWQHLACGLMPTIPLPDGAEVWNRWTEVPDGGGLSTHTLHKPSDSVSQCILNYSHQQLWCCRSHCPGKRWGGGGRKSVRWVVLKCDAESLLRRDDSVCRLHRDPQRQRIGGVCEWLTKSSIFRFSGTLHYRLCAVKKSLNFPFYWSLFVRNVNYYIIHWNPC